MENAITASIRRSGRLTTCSTASDRVTLWAIVNAVMIFASERSPPPGNSNPKRKSKWS